ncbi:MAG: aspartate kinase [Bacteroidota bacterium]
MTDLRETHMQVCKFGGGVIQTAQDIQKMADLLQAYRGQPLVIVVSALAKTTQQLEAAFRQRSQRTLCQQTIAKICQWHRHVIADLFQTRRGPVQQVLTHMQAALQAMLGSGDSATGSDQLYSRTVAWGEITASRIIQAYLATQYPDCVWIDARQCIKTQHGSHQGRLDWEATTQRIRTHIAPRLKQNQWILTQGFISSDVQGHTTTLGKEGSDFTGAILAAILGAKSLTIWKDVPGIMSADPKLLAGTVMFERLSYSEMATMAACGAQVIHPKTVDPLAAHGIPLYVKPWQDRYGQGTVIDHGEPQVHCPVYMLLAEQRWIRLSLCEPASADAQYIDRVQVDLKAQEVPVHILSQASSSLSLCLPSQTEDIDTYIAQTYPRLTKQIVQPVTLLTIMRHTGQLPETLLKGYKILSEQPGKALYQAILQPLGERTAAPA